MNKNLPEKLVLIKRKESDIKLWLESPTKFDQEQGSFCIGHLTVHIIGIITNWNDLIKEYGVSSKIILLENLINKKKINLQHYLKGAYTILIENKETTSWEIFSDPQGNTTLFYWKSENEIILTSNFQNLLDLIKSIKIELDFVPERAYQLLTFGYMLENQTPFRNIFKLTPNQKITIGTDDVKLIYINTGFATKNSSNHNTLKDLCYEFNHIFEKTIIRNFNLDNKYGYNHLVSLSAGLDSRVVTYIANKLGFGKKITNITFSQSNYYDEYIPYKIIKELNHKWIYNPLNSGGFLENLEDILYINGGLSIYYGMSHAYDTMKIASEQNFGIVHTGQLGDAILGGTYPRGAFDPDLHFWKGAYSTMLKNKVCINTIKNNYSTVKEYLFQNRGLNFINYGSQPYQINHYTLSPFLDNDILEFVNQVPNNLLDDYYLYDQWILTCHPEIAKFKHNGTRSIGRKNYNRFTLFNRSIDINLLPKKIYEKIIERRKYSLLDMNPIAGWIEQNSYLKNFLDKIIEENIDLLDEYPELKKDVKYLYNFGIGKEKLLAITFLSAYKKWQQ